MPDVPGMADGGMGIWLFCAWVPSPPGARLDPPSVSPQLLGNPGVIHRRMLTAAWAGTMECPLTAQGQAR